MINQSMNQLLTISYQGKENQLLTQLELTDTRAKFSGCVAYKVYHYLSWFFVEGQPLQAKEIC